MRIKVVIKGPNFGKPKRKVNWEKVKKSLVKDLQNLIEGKLSANKKTSMESLISSFQQRLTRNFQTRIKPCKSNLFLKQIEVVSCL